MNLLIDFFLIGGIVINAIILVLLFKSSKKELSHKLLILFFAMLLFFMAHNYADIHDLDILFVLTFIFNDIIELFIGPLIYMYIKSLFEDNKSLIRKNWIHFSPLLLYIIFISIPMLISVIQQQFIFNYLEFLNSISETIFALFMIYLNVYLLLSLWLFFKYRSIMQLNFSSLSETDFGWVRHMLIGSIIVTFIDLIVIIYDITTSNESGNYITIILLVLLIVYLGYYGIKQTKILLPDFLLQEENEVIILRKKEPLVVVESEEFEIFKSRLLKVMQEEKVFLDEDLTLSKLAELIPTKDKKLSHLLNQYMDTTFYDFINKYRVASVKEKMKSNDFENLTLLGIAYESGFKSKTSFNRIFKKETGMSPSEYKKSL